jgi:hypothetical protein
MRRLGQAAACGRRFILAAKVPLAAMHAACRRAQKKEPPTEADGSSRKHRALYIFVEFRAALSPPILA